MRGIVVKRSRKKQGALDLALIATVFIMTTGVSWFFFTQIK